MRTHRLLCNKNSSINYLWVLGVLLSVAAIEAAPIARVYLKFISEPHSYEHGYTTSGGTTIAQKSYLSIGIRRPRNFGDRIQINDARQNYLDVEERPRNVRPENAEFLIPRGVFVPPISLNDLGYSSEESGHRTPDFSDGTQYADSFLLTGEEAKYAVRYIYGRGELFFTDYPHVRSLLRNQDERRQNGLPRNILSSLRPDSPFYRKFMN
ncbi:uncharacterized protein LOC117169167 isoform X2 [Belonocnema kinseyi]|uniref:uncharacterized protein LOC117169167 isoform X2 n=1 Tax=Belonocnema kinseyi TaxID=2817044 RepID=UPI00143DA1FB|nr:uncharacterized protein LOC117169167 isoform X2 [Belonocnema kinseyi]